MVLIKDCEQILLHIFGNCMMYLSMLRLLWFDGLVYFSVKLYGMTVYFALKQHFINFFLVCPNFILGSGMSGGGIGVGTSNLGMLSSGISGSLGMNNSMAADRMMGASAMGMGMSGSSMGAPSPVGMGMGGASSMMSSSNVMGRSSMDSMGHDSYQLGSGVSRGFRDGFDRHNDSFSSASLSDTVILGNVCVF